MDALTYKLEEFEGPLDLLLSLIHKNKVNIVTVARIDNAFKQTDWIVRICENLKNERTYKKMKIYNSQSRMKEELIPKSPVTHYSMVRSPKGE